MQSNANRRPNRGQDGMTGLVRTVIVYALSINLSWLFAASDTALSPEEVCARIENRQGINIQILGDKSCTVAKAAVPGFGRRACFLQRSLR